MKFSTNLTLALAITCVLLLCFHDQNGVYAQQDCPSCFVEESFIYCDGINTWPCYDLADVTSIIITNSPNLTEIPPKYFEKGRLLEEIVIRVTAITNLDYTTFSNNPSLASVYFEKNEITAIHPDIFRNNPLLRSLSFHGNLITTIDQDIFENNPSLTSIALGGNQIDTIHPAAFRNNPMLGYIHLEGNNIASLDLESFKYIPSLVQLNIGENILCGHSIHWLKTWLKVKTPSRHYLFGTCLNGEDLNEYLSGVKTYVPSPTQLSFGSTVSLFSDSNGLASIEVARSGPTNTETHFRVEYKLITEYEQDFTICQRDWTINEGDSTTKVPIVFHGDKLNLDNIDIIFELTLVPEGITTIGAVTNVTISPSMVTTEDIPRSGSTTTVVVIFTICVVILLVIILVVWYFVNIKTKSKSYDYDAAGSKQTVSHTGEEKPTTSDIDLEDRKV